MIEARGLCKSFLEGGRPHQVLRDLNLEVAAGESVALLGRSGSGKTSLLNLLSGIDVPDSGEIHLDGKPIHSMDERSRTLFRRRHLGFVFQFFNLIPTLTVYENLLLPLQLNGIEDSDRAGHLLARVGLESRRDDFPDLLSGGEQQRVAIARALVHEPSLLFADEPTGNLDIDTGEQVAELLFDTVERQHTTLLMVTHSDYLAERADRALRLDSGRL